ncbi:MAG: hypothetical protein ACTTIZ_03170 [Treponema sp.]
MKKYFILLGILTFFTFITCNKGVNAVYTISEDGVTASIAFKSNLTFTLAWTENSVYATNYGTVHVSGTYDGLPGGTGTTTFFTVEKAFHATSGKKASINGEELKNGTTFMGESHGNILTLFGKKFTKQ